MLRTLERHDLLFLTRAGRKEAWERREAVSEETLVCWTDYPSIPAIFTGRTDEQEPELLQIGFSYPKRIGPMRCRMGSGVSKREVETVVTPRMAAQHAADTDGPVGQLAAWLLEVASGSGVELGLFGATALQSVTGLPYLHSGSDLDVVLRVPSPQALEKFWAQLEMLERDDGIRIDAELHVSRTQYIKCKELFSSQQTVLVKGGAVPQLLSRRTVWDMLSSG